MTGKSPDKKEERRSGVPKYDFTDTLQEQERQLKDNPMMKRFAQSRETLSADPHRPLYHFVSPESSMNDPNGLCFWQGRWHLFYQGYPPEDRRQHWGHAVSSDLVHWHDLPYAIYPDPEKCCYSGSTLVEESRVIAMYHGTEAGNMVAVSDDPLLLNWEKVSGRPVIPLALEACKTQPAGSSRMISVKDANGNPGFFNVFDPCIWKKNGMYYSLSAGRKPEGPDGKPVRANFLLRSSDLVHWDYLHPFVEGDIFTLVGDDGACPYFWPVGDRHILLFFSHMSGGQALLGDYDTERDKFVATSHHKFNFGAAAPAGVHAPSAAPDGEGGVNVIFNMNPGKPTKGWNQVMSLARKLTLTGRDTIEVKPAGDIESLRGKHQAAGPICLPANREVVLEGIEGKVMEIAAEIELNDAAMLEMNVFRSPDGEERTRIMFFQKRGYRNRDHREDGPPYGLISIDSSYSSLAPDVRSRAPETAPVLLQEEEPLKLRVFIDRSVVEVFVNGKQCVAIRVYPDRPDSQGVSLRSQGREAQLKSLDAWEMKSIYET